MLAGSSSECWLGLNLPSAVVVGTAGAGVGVVCDEFVVWLADGAEPRTIQMIGSPSINSTHADASINRRLTNFIAYNYTPLL